MFYGPLIQHYVYQVDMYELYLSVFILQSVWMKNIDATFVALSTTVWRTLLINVLIPIHKIPSNTENLNWMNDQGNSDIVT